MRRAFSIILTIAIVFCLFPPLNVSAASTWSTYSPDSSICMDLVLANDGSLTYTVRKNNNIVISSSKLGINTNHADFNSGMSFVSTDIGSWNNTYSVPSAKKTTYTDNCTQRELILSKNGHELRLYVRVYNDGIAYR